MNAPEARWWASLVLVVALAAGLGGCGISVEQSLEQTPAPAAADDPSSPSPFEPVDSLPPELRKQPPVEPSTSESAEATGTPVVTLAPPEFPDPLFQTLPDLEPIGEPPREEIYEPQEGDVVFQSLPSNRLTDAIEGATNSPYSHCGMVVQREGHLFVIEGIGPVRETPMAAWVLRGRGARYDAYRPNDELAGKIPAVVKQARKYLGRPYDIRYRLDDEKIYCSELVYKAFLEATGEKLGQLKTLGELKWEPFRELIHEIEGSVPLDRKIITPADLAVAGQLKCVHRSMPRK